MWATQLSMLCLSSPLQHVMAISISNLAQEILGLCIFVQHPSPNSDNVLIAFFCNDKVLLKTPWKLLCEEHPTTEKKKGG